MEVRFTNNTVNNWIFKGKNSALIDKKLKGILNFKGNYFTNIGYLEETEKRLPDSAVQGDKEFPYTPKEKIYWRQAVGVFNIENS